MFSVEELYELVVRASTLDERLSGSYVPVSGAKTDTETAARRLAAWCQSASGGDWNLFAKRLFRDGWTLESVRPRLATVELAVNARLPSWAEDSFWITSALETEVEITYVSALCSAGLTQPFEALFFGLIAAAELRRDALLTELALSRVEPAVRRSMAHELLADVTRLCAMALYNDFLQYLKKYSDVPISNSSRKATRLRYDAFMLDMRATGLRRLLLAKPVLLRLLACGTTMARHDHRVYP